MEQQVCLVCGKTPDFAGSCQEHVQHARYGLPLMLDIDEAARAKMRQFGWRYTSAYANMPRHEAWLIVQKLARPYLSERQYEGYLHLMYEDKMEFLKRYIDAFLEGFEQGEEGSHE